MNFLLNINNYFKRNFNKCAKVYVYVFNINMTPMYYRSYKNN